MVGRWRHARSATHPVLKSSFETYAREQWHTNRSDRGHDSRTPRSKHELLNIESWASGGAGLWQPIDDVHHEMKAI